MPALALGEQTSASSREAVQRRQPHCSWPRSAGLGGGVCTAVEAQDVRVAGRLASWSPTCRSGWDFWCPGRAEAVSPDFLRGPGDAGGRFASLGRVELVVVVVAVVIVVVGREFLVGLVVSLSCCWVGRGVFQNAVSSQVAS